MKNEILSVLVVALLVAVLVAASLGSSYFTDAGSAATTIGGTSYYYENVSNSHNDTDVLFHGVTFTFLQIPSTFDYSNPKNYTYAGSVRLTNGTLLNLSEKTVMIGMASFTYLPGFALTFPDGFVATHRQYTLTARYEKEIPDAGGKPGYLLSYTGIWPIANPWFTQHDNIRAGVFWNITNTTGIIFSLNETIYVSV